jgi:hypothetical protein
MPGLARSVHPSRPRLVGVLALVALLAAGAAMGGLRDGIAAPNPAALSAPAAPGETRAEPVPLGDEGAAGPWRMAVLEVLTGQAATDRVLAASPTNEPPREGATYVAVRLAARNAGGRAMVIDGHDFAVTGGSGLVRRFVGAVPPEPALDGEVAPGAAREGWIVGGAAADETSLLLLFDGLALPGVWADRVFALQDGASVASAAGSGAPNDVGTDPAAPAGPNEPIVTADWEIELLEVVRGAAVFDLVDYRTGALGVDDSADWLALRLRMGNVRAGGPGDQPATLPPGAFALVDETGAPLTDVATLTPPSPDAAGVYYPGATREGWVSFELPLGYTATTVRFLPYATDADPRFLTFG